MATNIDQIIDGRPIATTANSGLAKVAVQCSASTFVIKTAIFAKSQNVVRQCKKTANPQMTHLVFADTQPNAQKPKEPFFTNARTNQQTEKSKFDDLQNFRHIE